jgi:hypothetical protein
VGSRLGRPTLRNCPSPGGFALDRGEPPPPIYDRAKLRAPRSDFRRLSTTVPGGLECKCHPCAGASGLGLRRPCGGTIAWSFFFAGGGDLRSADAGAPQMLPPCVPASGKGHPRVCQPLAKVTVRAMPQPLRVPGWRAAGRRARIPKTQMRAFPQNPDCGFIFREISQIQKSQGAVGSN